MGNELVISSVSGVIAAVVGAAIVVVGWRVAHRQELERDRIANQREHRLTYVVNAYRTLLRTVNRPLTRELADRLEEAVADIELFGSPRQVDLVHAFARTIAGTGGATLNDLLEDLRQDLRQELGAEVVDRQLLFFQMDANSGSGRAPG